MAEQDLEKRLTELVEKDLGITQRALEKITVIAPGKSYTRKIAEDFLEMAKAYFNDAKHFKENRDLIRAVACVNYAHAWLDAGARLGVFDVGEDDQLFTLAE
ncbi:DUF357 domain-containing protein [[Eubacterium] cellulosolvens]